MVCISWDIGYLPKDEVAFVDNATLAIYTTSSIFADSEDACVPLPDETPDLSDKLVLIYKDGCSLESKERWAALKGAKYVWFYTSKDVPVASPSIRGVLKSKGQGMITYAAAEKIYSDIAAGTNVTVSFSQTELTWLLNEATGGKILKSSSWGPGAEGEMGPVRFTEAYCLKC